MPRIDDMALFVAAIDAGSLSGAARKCDLSLSSVSRHLTALEERLGTRLVIRTTRMLSLTEAGTAYYERAKQILSEIDAIEVSLSAHAEAPTGRLNVSGPTLFGREYLLPILARFVVAHPRITLDVMLTDRHVNLVEEGIDLAIRIGELKDSSLIARKLGSLRWVVSAAPSYLTHRGTPRRPVELSEHDGLIYGQEAEHAIWPMKDGARTINIAVPVKMRSNTLDGVIAAALAGAGLAYAPAWAIADHVATGRLRVVLREFELPPRPINAVFTHSRLLSVKVRSLLDVLAEELANVDFDRVPVFARKKNRVSEPGRN